MAGLLDVQRAKQIQRQGARSPGLLDILGTAAGEGVDWFNRAFRRAAGLGPLEEGETDTGSRARGGADLAGVAMTGAVPGGIFGAPAGALAAGAARPRRSLLDLNEGRPLPEASRPGRIVNETKAGGGYSVHVPTGGRPSEGLMMGTYRNTDPRNVVTDDLRRGDVERSLLTNWDALQRPDAHLGTWRDPDTGKTYIDVARRFAPDDVRKATKFGERTGQLAGYDLGRGASFPVGRIEDFVMGPEFFARQRELVERGSDYLRRSGAPENWWPIRGTVLEEAYGPENMRALSGFIATTAPNTAPRENMRLASEYMRRHLAGEPVVDPSWRAPEGLLGLAPGRQMPMEKPRVPNLRRVVADNPEALRREKVNDEFLSLEGSLTNPVVDRWHIRAAEDPARGYFVGPVEGEIGSSKNYRLLSRGLTSAADQLGLPPSIASSLSWTGARETARDTGSLFGVPYRAKSIPTESYGYPAHAADLIKAKAQQLGVSEAEVMRRLRGGAISLLSSAPVGVGLLGGRDE